MNETKYFFFFNYYFGLTETNILFIVKNCLKRVELANGLQYMYLFTFIILNYGNLKQVMSSNLIQVEV